jgi:hypothetical protein
MKTDLPLIITWLCLMLIAQQSHAQQSTNDHQGIDLNWLDTQPSLTATGSTWGMPWPKGQISKDQKFKLTNHNGSTLPLQTWPLAYWPDGSIKWTAHATAISSNQLLKAQITPSASSDANPSSQISYHESDDTLIINNGLLTFHINKKGETLINRVERNKRIVATNGHLILLMQNAPDQSSNTTIERCTYKGSISEVTLEQNGPIRAVVRIKGTHKSESRRDLLPFVVRLTIYANGENMKMAHTIIYDANENEEFVKGIGVSFDVPMTDEAYNRHIRFTGSEGGVFAESVQTVTGLRRETGSLARLAQIGGQKVTDIETYAAERMQYVPKFGDYTLFQPTPDGFDISKRTADAYGWIRCTSSTRASGVGYVGGVSGGLAFGLRHFWEMYPSQLDIRHAAQQTAQVTLWSWAPNAPAMDLRFYHDGLGQDTYAKQWDGLEITYEDYEEGYGSPYGVARTNEMDFWFTASTPSNADLANYAKSVNRPPLLTSSNTHMAACGVFGQIWGVRDTTTSTQKNMAKALDQYFDFYKQQVAEHKWYGFWDFGDVMHTYDSDRHMWRYDVGGYAWDNSELSTDLWLWYYYLHAGRPDAFRMAEAMSRHTGEVDVHHIGPFAPLGSRHNVMHWGCSAKQLRISTAINRRFLYYLTADERIGELLSNQVEAHKTLLTIKPQRKRTTTTHPLDQNPNYISMGFGTDWGALAAAWLTEWERTGDEATLQRLKNSMQSIASQPKGFFSSSSFMNIHTGTFEITRNKKASAQHLSAVFGLFEICAELTELIPDRPFRQAWIQYCQYYNATDQEQKKALGNELGKLGLRQGHSRLTAYAAYQLNNQKLANRAYNELMGNNKNLQTLFPITEQITAPHVMQPVTYAPGVSTNGTAQWGLSAIQALFLIESMFKE